MSEAKKANDIRTMLLDAAGLSLEKLPMLRVIFDRTATLCSEGLRELTDIETSYGFASMENGRIGDILKPYDTKAVVGVFHAPGWDSHLILGLDRGFIFTMLEVLLGADGSEPAFEPEEEERAFSAVELRIAAMMFEQAASALQASFSPVSDTAFNLERTETRMDFAASGRREALAVSAKFEFQAFGHGGEMFVVIPHAALTPMRQALSRVIAPETHASDPVWARQIRDELHKTSVSLRAILEERRISLAEVANFKVGQVIELQANPESRIKVESKEQPLFWCQLGQSDGAYRLRIEDYFDQEREFVNDILSS